MSKATSHSRRGISAPHGSDRSRIRRCPVCRWAVDQDHAEALAMDAARTRGRSLPPNPARSSRPEVEEPVAAGFALV